MAKIIGLPKLSPTMEEGTLVRWVKQEGQAVEIDDLIAEVETDKATMEFRSFDKGVLLKQLVPEGATLSPDQPVAIFGNEGEDISALLKQAGGGGGGEPVQAPAPSGEAAAPQRKTGDVEEGKAPGDEPEKRGETSQPDVQRAASSESDQSEPPVTGRVLASPVVRKIAREKSIDLGSIHGSGPGGRVIMRDLEGAEARVGLPGAALRGPSTTPPAQKPSAPPAQQPSARAPSPEPAPSVPQGAGRSEKLSQMRKVIARRLSESKREVPHFYLTIDVDAEPLLALRAQLNGELASSGEKLSVNDLLIKACATALRRMPRVNASFTGDAIFYYDSVAISVAVAVPDGLVTPVVRDADRLGVLAISQAVRDLATRARAKKLKPEEMQGGTFSISNLGMYGIDAFAAVINPPEGAILAVGAVRDEPVVRGGAVVAGKRMALTLSCDHRVIDGALGAEWLKLLRTLVEQPVNMLL